MNIHAGIFGPTDCGKTFLAISMCADFEQRGIRTLVCDPYCSAYPATWKTRDISEFLKKAKSSRSCALFVDETGQLDLRNPEHEWILTGSKHWGHVCHVSGQTGTHLPPVGRASISRLFLFRSMRETAEYWRDAFTDEKIMEAVTLKQFEFMHAERWGAVKKSKLSPP